jgi:hypothetical protein
MPPQLPAECERFAPTGPHKFCSACQHLVNDSPQGAPLQNSCTRYSSRTPARVRLSGPFA